MFSVLARMPRWRLLALGTGVIVIAAVIVFIARRSPAEIDVPWRVPGDVDVGVAALDREDMPEHARALLASDRPWRAALVMREYLRGADDAPADLRVLAARAEAEWGAWPQAGALLEDVKSLDTHENGIGLYLLARARDEMGDAERAAAGYRAFLALSAPAGTMAAERSAARLRLGLALTRAGNRAAARQQLEAASAEAGDAAVWVALLAADALAHTGDTAAVRAAVADYEDGLPGLRAWRARITAAARAGDAAGARALANRARAWAESETTRAEFLVSAARAALEMGDTAAARDALRGAVDRAAGNRYGRAAAELLRAGRMTPADHLAIARVYRAQGFNEESLAGFRRWLESDAGTDAERAAVRMEYATALFYAERFNQVAAALRPIATRTDARFLIARAESHRDNADAAVRIYLDLAARFPRSGTGAQALFLAAGAWHEDGKFERARELYQRVVREYPGTDQMGHALMRLAGMAFVEDDHREAARIWDEYRAKYPRGSRALQSTYWSARAREEMGDSAAAAALFRTVIASDRDSYYAVLSSERLGVPFWPLPLAPAPAADRNAAQRVAGWMRGIDLLRTAGFAEEAAAAADGVRASAGNDRPTLYALAEALAERGYTRNGILIGLRLQGRGQPDRRLLRILYPFPYRTLITEEARDRGLDPFVAAALIRQESMFEARITSPVGARGLMQVMPATGGQLAAAEGIDEWDPEMLYHPEINVHLGTRYLMQHMENYDGSLPAVFSAYNAGPHRVERWSKFPEYGADELFTERIPFAETRGYVKILTRNRALMRGLYGAED